MAASLSAKQSGSQGPSHPGDHIGLLFYIGLLFLTGLVSSSNSDIVAPMQGPTAESAPPASPPYARQFSNVIVAGSGSS